MQTLTKFKKLRSNIFYPGTFVSLDSCPDAKFTGSRSSGNGSFMNILVFRIFPRIIQKMFETNSSFHVK